MPLLRDFLCTTVVALLGTLLVWRRLHASGSLPLHPADLLPRAQPSASSKGWARRLRAAFVAPHTGWFLGDAVVLTALLLGGWWFACTYYSFGEQPYEDAAMVMRYAEHLAQGHGLAWNIGEAPVDGATDFLFTVVLAGLIKLGATGQTGVLILGYVTHFATIALVYLGVRRLWQSSWLVAALSAALIVCGPGAAYVATGFGTPFFGLFAGLSWYLAIHYAQVRASGRPATALGIAFAATALIAGLIRPEGVLLSAFLVLAVLIKLGYRHSSRLLIPYVIVFVSLGGAYFVWRWAYFGYPLPNPYYKKGGGKLYLSSLRGAARQVLTWTSPFCAVFLAGFRHRTVVRDTLFLLIPIVGFTGIWVLMSPEMNWLGRFQYAALVLFALSWGGALVGLRRDWQPGRLLREPWPQLALVALTAIFVVRTFRFTTPEPISQAEDGLHSIATLLSNYGDRGYTMATTEAGVLPYVSKWRAIDTWGLNDSWVAHHGVISYEYLDGHKPELIVADAFYSPETKSFIGASADYPNYDTMIATMVQYAERNRYVLAAIFAKSPERAHYYYVKSDCPDSREIVQGIQAVNYVWPGSREVVSNIAPR